MPKRPLLKNQPPRRIVRKEVKPQEVNLGDTFVIADISIAFRRLKASLLEKLTDFDKEADDLIVDVKNKTDEQITDSREKFDEATDTLDSETQATTARVEKEVDVEVGRIGTLLGERLKTFTDGILKTFLQKVTEEFNQKKFEIQRAIDHALTVKKGDPGEPGLSIKGDKGEDAVLTAKMFKKLIKELPDGFLKIEHIAELLRRLENAEAKASGALASGGGQGSWKQVVLTGTIDGANTTFTYAGEPASEFSERVFLNYIEQNPLTDYTHTPSTNTIEYTVVPDDSLSDFPHIIRYM